MNQKIIHVFSVVMKTFAIFVSIILYPVGLVWIGIIIGKRLSNKKASEKVFSPILEEKQDSEFNKILKETIDETEKEVVLDL